MEKKSDTSERANVKNGNESSPDEIIAEPLQILEAVLFASENAVSMNILKSIIPGQPDARRIKKMIGEINRKLQTQRHPFEIADVAGGYQFKTVPYFAPWVRQLFKDKPVKRLSAQALECLAVIAYKQPITKAEVEEIRGVLSDGAMKTVLEKRLVTITGRSDKPGRPLLYGTTNEFLDYFGLKSISDLPKIEEFEEMARKKMEDVEEEIQSLPEEEIPSAGKQDNGNAEMQFEEKGDDDPGEASPNGTDGKSSYSDRENTGSKSTATRETRPAD
ncbi:MAG: SMC-Scp complex subunit ScpB [Chitinivibrionales bacterium]|nr:SMC-Scp complex subunit ScpB [Chitinivibrionales bacterium]